MKHRLDISMKQNEFKNLVEDEVLFERSKVLNDEKFNSNQILTVAAILPFLDISLPDSKTNEMLASTKAGDSTHDFMYSTQEFEKVLDLITTRLDTV